VKTHPIPRTRWFATLPLLLAAPWLAASAQEGIPEGSGGGGALGWLTVAFLAWLARHRAKKAKAKKGNGPPA
jgi:hypothetical protein